VWCLDTATAPGLLLVYCKATVCRLWPSYSSALPSAWDLTTIADIFSVCTHTPCSWHIAMHLTIPCLTQTLISPLSIYFFLHVTATANNKCFYLNKTTPTWFEIPYLVYWNSYSSRVSLDKRCIRIWYIKFIFGSWWGLRLMHWCMYTHCIFLLVYGTSPSFLRR